MVFLKAEVKSGEEKVIFSQLRNENGTNVAYKAFVADLKEKHGEDADFMLLDVHYV
ncbi:hypothetical protein ABRR14_005095 [Escherichia coli]